MSIAWRLFNVGARSLDALDCFVCDFSAFNAGQFIVLGHLIKSLKLFRNALYIERRKRRDATVLIGYQHCYLLVLSSGEGETWDDVDVTRLFAPDESGRFVLL